MHRLDGHTEGRKNRTAPFYVIFIKNVVTFGLLLTMLLPLINSMQDPVVNAQGVITTVAGNGTQGFNGDGAPALETSLNRPFTIFVDASGNIYIADHNNHRIRKVDTSGIITTVAGNGIDGFSGDGGPAIDASLDEPAGVVIDASGNIFIADAFNHRIRKVDSESGIITTIAGNGIDGFGGDGGPATEASLDEPYNVS